MIGLFFIMILKRIEKYLWFYVIFVVVEVMYVGIF